MRIAISQRVLQEILNVHLGQSFPNATKKNVVHPKDVNLNIQLSVTRKKQFEKSAYQQWHFSKTRKNLLTFEMKYRNLIKMIRFVGNLLKMIHYAVKARGRQEPECFDITLPLPLSNKTRVSRLYYATIMTASLSSAIVVNAQTSNSHSDYMDTAVLNIFRHLSATFVLCSSNFLDNFYSEIGH